MIKLIPNILYTPPWPSSQVQAKHLGGSAFYMVHMGLPEQALGWFQCSPQYTLSA